MFSVGFDLSGSGNQESGVTPTYMYKEQGIKPVFSYRPLFGWNVPSILYERPKTAYHIILIHCMVRCFLRTIAAHPLKWYRSKVVIIIALFAVFLSTSYFHNKTEKYKGTFMQTDRKSRRNCVNFWKYRQDFPANHLGQDSNRAMQCPLSLQIQGSVPPEP